MVNGEWVWPDGTKAIYTNWYEIPSGDNPFTAIGKKAGKWYDFPSSYERGAVCQYDPYSRGSYTTLKILATVAQ